MHSHLYSPEKNIWLEHFHYPADYEMPRFHLHNAYELCIPVTGEYTLVTMDEAFRIGPRDVSYTRPGCMHKSFVSSGSELLILYFGELFLNRFFTPESRLLLLQDFRLTHFRIKTEVFPEVKALCLQLGDLAAKNDYARIYPRFVRLVHLLSTEYREESRETGSLAGRAGPLAAGILSYLWQHYQDAFTLDDIASHFFITKYHLCRVFKAATGSTVMEHLNSIRLLHACRLLQNTEESITGISHICGFHSSAYFTRLFKETLGVTPRVYRKNSLTGPDRPAH